MTIKYDRNLLVDVEFDDNRRIEITEPRIGFDLRYSATDTPSEGMITLYDLATPTAEAIQTSAKSVRFLGGYQGSNGLLFDGVIRRVEHERDGLERQTRLILGGKTIIPPGAGADHRAVDINTAGEEISLKEAVASVVEQLNLELGDTSPLPDIRSPEFYAGGEDGTKVLTGWLRAIDIEWYEEKGIVQFSKKRERSNHVADVEVSEETGMVGTPRVEFDDQDGISVGVKTLLNPAIELTTVMRVKSEIITGEFKVVELTHQGDNWTRNNFNTEAEGVTFE